MKLINIVVSCILSCCFFTGVVDSVLLCKKIENRQIKLKKEVLSQKFVSESFKSACDGFGFTSLNDWQQCCRAMFNMNYIAWCDAQDFMEVSFENNPRQLLYGNWKSEICSGEIYYRKSE